MPAVRAFARYSAITFIVLLGGSYAFSQSGGQTGGSTGGGSTTRSAPAPRPSTPQQRQPEERRPVFLSGRVVLDDGTPPQERVSIERVCNGRVRRETYSDSQGHFSMQLGAEMQVFQDATVGSSFDSMRGMGMGESNSSPSSMATGPANAGVTTRDLMGCELRASLPGFRSDSISLAGRQLFDNPDVGTIVLHRIGKVEGTRISVTTLKAPKDAKKAYERGTNLLKKKKSAEAAEEFAKAVAIYPKFADALVQMGEIYNDQGREEEAATAFQQAIDADPQLIPPYFHLALIAGRKQDWKRMAELSERALALNAYEYPAAYYFNAVANYNLQKLDVAEKNARAARRLDSQYHIPRIDLVLANILLRHNDYAGAATQLRSFLKYVPSGDDATMARQLLGQTESKLASAPNPQ
jgi:tetratricopeptide (TPR) repeat protein